MLKCRLLEFNYLHIFTISNLMNFVILVNQISNKSTSLHKDIQGNTMY